MNLKISLIGCCLVLLASTELNARGYEKLGIKDGAGGQKDGEKTPKVKGPTRDKGNGHGNYWQEIKFAKKLCSVFAGHSIADGEGTVGDFCDKLKSEIMFYLEPIVSQIKDFMEIKVNKVKETVKDVCDSEDFAGNPEKRELCEKLQEEEFQDLERLMVQFKNDYKNNYGRNNYGLN